MVDAGGAAVVAADGVGGFAAVRGADPADLGAAGGACGAFGEAGAGACGLLMGNFAGLEVGGGEISSADAAGWAR